MESIDFLVINTIDHAGSDRVCGNGRVPSANIEAIVWIRPRSGRFIRGLPLSLNVPPVLARTFCHQHGVEVPSDDIR